MCLTEAINSPESNGSHANWKPETRIITLNYGENLEQSVFRFQKGSINIFYRNVNYQI